MSNREYNLYLKDIYDSIEKIEDYVKDLSFEGFDQDAKTIDAVVRNFEIIGEAARHIPKNIISQYPQIPWSKMVSTRNKVLHEYFGIDTEILWKTIKEDLPILKERIKGML